MQHLHPGLDGLHADRDFGQHEVGLFLRFGLLGIAYASKFLLAYNMTI